MIERQPDPTRNSWLRKKTSVPIEIVTQRLHECFPDLTGDHVTLAGLLGVAAGAILAEKQNERGNVTLTDRLPTFVALALSSFCDAFDGPMARLIAQESPDKSHPLRGQIFDTASDRLGEMAMSISRAVTAHKRSDTLGEFLAYSSAFSNTIPSLSKALAESTSHVVPEAGKGPAGFLGTRVGRTLTNIPATVFPEFNKFPLQKTLDCINILANIITASDRIVTALQSQENPELLPEKIHDAKVRVGTDAVLVTVAAISAFISYKKLRE